MSNPLASYIDGKLLDLRDNLGPPYITDQDVKGLEVLRHTTAHILAEAINEIYPETQFGIGPITKNGFYYEVQNDNNSFALKDLPLIEEKMKDIVGENKPIYRMHLSALEIEKYFYNQKLKKLLIHSLKEETFSLYKQGNFCDLCKGPHMMSTGYVKAYFKLIDVINVTWRGESMQRIYGTAWFKKEDLEAYLEKMKKVSMYDHRTLGNQLSLFHFQAEAAGSVFWHPNGKTLYSVITRYIQNKLSKNNYQEVSTPVLMEESIWEKSGHLSKFSENMYSVQSKDKKLALKPMNCPGHIQIFNRETRSYKELPIRFSEFGSCFRNEPSGALRGLTRLSNFVQDDAHIFCTENQVMQEVISFTHLLIDIYKEFEFSIPKIFISGKPENFLGKEIMWRQAENYLIQAIEKMGLSYKYLSGEGAFYGPKIEFVLQDAFERDWQCGTIQLDFVLPKRLDCYYIDAQGEKKHTLILHRAILGSIERFIAILLEHHKGLLPIWLCPTQLHLLTLNNSYNEWSKKIIEKLELYDIRCWMDQRNETLSYKLRDAYEKKVPYVLVVGQKEFESHLITVKNLRTGKQSVQSIENLEKILQQTCGFPVYNYENAKN